MRHLGSIAASAKSAAVPEDRVRLDSVVECCLDVRGGEQIIGVIKAAERHASWYATITPLPCRVGGIQPNSKDVTPKTRCNGMAGVFALYILAVSNDSVMLKRSAMATASRLTSGTSR